MEFNGASFALFEAFTSQASLDGNNTSIILEILFSQYERQNNFYGLCLEMKFDKSFPSQILVLDKVDSAFKVPNELKNFEIKKFDEYFRIYGLNQDTVRDILSPNFMEKILNLKRSKDIEITLFFVDNKCYIFLNGLKNIFKPSYFKEPNLKDAKNLKDEILEILSLIDELKLNRARIWG